MSEIGAPSGPQRPSSEGPGRVVRAHRSRDNPEHTDDENRRDAPRHQQARARHHPHDPAVSLSATLAQVKPGTQVTGAVVAFDADDRLVLKAGGGVYTLEFDGSIPPSVRQAERVTVLITQTDHVIEARLTAADGRALSSPALVEVTLVRVPNAPGATKPDMPAPSVPFTRYGPATLKVIPDTPPAGGTGTGARDDDIARLVSPSPPLIRTGGGEGAPLQPPLANTESGAARGGAPQPLAFLPPEQLASTTGPRVAAGKVPPGLAQGGSSPAISATIPESVLTRAPEVAEGLAFVARIRAPGGDALPLTGPVTGEKAAAGFVSGQIVHVTVAAGSAGGNPSPASDASPALPPTATRTEAVVRADPGIPLNNTPSASLPPRHLATPVGDIPLPPANSLAVGTRVTVTIEPVAPVSSSAGGAPSAPSRPAPPGPSPSSVAPSSVPLTSAPAGPAPTTEIIWPPFGPLPLDGGNQDWPALSSLVAGAHQIDPGLGQAIAGKLPTPERPVNPVTLLFLNALGMKSPMRLLLGADGMETILKQGGGPTLRAVEEDMARLSRLTVEHGCLDWRPHAFPLQTGNGVEALLMLVRHAFEDGERHTPDDRDPDDNPRKMTRFVLDLELSRLGPVQVDGIVRTESFDLILRTGAPLGPGPEAEIEDLFSRALARNGFRGGCSFQIGHPFPVDVAAAIRQAEARSPARLA